MSRETALLMLVIVSFFIGTLAVSVRVQKVKASETIYIRADGSVDPDTASISSTNNVTYTLTGNISDGIVAERSDTIIDGNEYTLQGSGDGVGLNLTSVYNITIRNINIKNFEHGIRLEASSKISIQGSNIANNWHGVLLHYSSNNRIGGNNITANNRNGILLYPSSSNNTVSENNIANNEAGIWLDSSSRNTVSENNITANNEAGIRLGYSSNNNIINGNEIANNSNGIWLEFSSNYNAVSGNNITANNDHGVKLYSSSNNNAISGNNIASNEAGIRLGYFSCNNIVSGNKIANNEVGIWVEESDYNEFYHNYFIDNINQTYVQLGYVNTWDKGYPTGGNYWSDYEDKYPDATEIGESGLWDTAYIIDDNNTDNYPIVPEFPSLTISLLFTIATSIALMIHKGKSKTNPQIPI